MTRVRRSLGHAGIAIVILLWWGIPALADPRPPRPPITAMALDAASGELVVGSQAGLEVFDLVTRECVRRFDAMMPAIHDAKFSPDGEHLAIGGGEPGGEGKVVVLHWPDGEIVATAAVPADVIYSVSYSAAGDELATAEWGRVVRTWGAKDLAPRQSMSSHSRAVLATTYVPGSELLLSAGEDHSLRVWNPATGEPGRKLDNHTGVVHALAARPAVEGELPLVVSVGGDKTVRFWQPTIGRLVRFARLKSVPLSVAWLAGTSRPLVAVGCDDGHLRAIDAETLKVVYDEQVLTGWCHEVVAMKDTPRVVVAGTGRVWRVVDIPE